MTTHILRCRLCGGPRNACDCPECPSCQDVVEPECREHQLCWYCGEPSERLSAANACQACEHEAAGLRSPDTVLREAHLGARQLVDWLNEYDRDSGGPVVGLQAWIPELGRQVAAIVHEIRDRASLLEGVLHEASVQRERGGDV